MFGTNINFVSLDIKGAEPQLLTCLDIAGTFSSVPEMQGIFFTDKQCFYFLLFSLLVWAIETAYADNLIKFIDASMLTAGYTKSMALLQYDGSFLDDMWIMNRKKQWNTNKQLICKKQTSSLWDLMIKSVFPFQYPDVKK